MNIANIIIKKASIKEVEQLQKISKLTFIETYSAQNSEENMTKYLTEEFSIEKLTDELNHKNADFFFAIVNNEIIGYLKVNFSEIAINQNKALEIKRIYVLKEFHGKNVGQILYNKAIQIAKQKNANYIWLGVWEKNPRALSFYKKNGFVEFDKHIFNFGDDKQTDLLMKQELTV